MIFGMLREIDALVDLYGASRCVMAFDSGGAGHRHAILPSYKGNRHKDETPEQEAAREDLYIQLTKLRSRIFPELGYRNVFKVKGFEADDIIAQCVQQLGADDEFVIATGDEDLWQCLEPRVSWYSPASRKVVTSAGFREEWGLDPSQWADVKALAGCGSDNVPGIAGIGPKKAAQWYRGELKQDSKTYKTILDNLGVYNTNIKLVRLPFPGLELPELVDDEVTESKKIKVQTELGIRPSRRARASREFDL